MSCKWLQVLSEATYWDIQNCGADLVENRRGCNLDPRSTSGATVTVVEGEGV